MGVELGNESLLRFKCMNHSQWRDNWSHGSDESGTISVKECIKTDGKKSSNRFWERKEGRQHVKEHARKEEQCNRRLWITKEEKDLRGEWNIIM